MANLHTHRKLLAAKTPNSDLTDTTEDPTVQTCLYFCKPQTNNTSPSTGFCPHACLAICPSVCQYSLSSLPLPQDFPPSKPNKSHNLSPLLICMLVLLATAFLLIALYVLYTKLCYNFYVPNSNSTLQTRTRRRRRRDGEGSYSVDEEHRSRMVFHPFWCIPTIGLPPTVISSIPVHKYGKEVEERDCVVCLAEFEEGDEVRVLPKCNHAFHVPCIDTWLSSHTTCPLCRAPIIPPDHDDHDHHQKHKDEDTSSSLTSVEGATGDNSPAEVLSIHVISGEEEVQAENTSDDPIENTPNKDQEALGEVTVGSCSQTWTLERGAANLLSRSLSCSGKIFSSRSNTRPSPDS